jgi:hypothetical protein
METILSRIASYRSEIERLQQEIANLEPEHEKEILAAALRDRQDAGMSATSGFENFVLQKHGMSLAEAELVEAALRDRGGVEGVEGA